MAFWDRMKHDRQVKATLMRIDGKAVKYVARRGRTEDGSTTTANHYATLVYWANYRKNHPAEELRASSEPHYETVSEHNARIVRGSDKWIDEYYAQKRKAANEK